MKRYTAVRVLTQAISENDLSIYIGNDVCKEAFPYRKHENNIYMEEKYDGLLSFALGVAMCTEKRVFVFCEDQYFINNISELMQMGVSKCRNLFLIMLVSGSYSEVSNTPTIFDSINSQHGVLYNMGFVVHDYKRIFNTNKNPVKNIREFWKRAKGPIAVLLKVDKAKKTMPHIIFSSQETLCEISSFVINHKSENDFMYD